MLSVTWQETRGYSRKVIVNVHAYAGIPWKLVQLTGIPVEDFMRMNIQLTKTVNSFGLRTCVVILVSSCNYSLLSWSLSLVLCLCTPSSQNSSQATIPYRLFWLHQTNSSRACLYYFYPPPPSPSPSLFSPWCLLTCKIPLGTPHSISLKLDYNSSINWIR